MTTLTVLLPLGSGRVRCGPLAMGVALDFARIEMVAVTAQDSGRTCPVNKNHRVC